MMSPMQVASEVYLILDKAEEARCMFPKIRGNFTKGLKAAIYTVKEVIRDLAIRAKVAGQEIIVKKFKFLQDENFRFKEKLWKFTRGLKSRDSVMRA